MWIGWLQFDLLLGDVRSLKQKRSVIRPVIAERGNQPAFFFKLNKDYMRMGKALCVAPNRKPVDLAVHQTPSWMSVFMWLWSVPCSAS